MPPRRSASPLRAQDLASRSIRAALLLPIRLEPRQRQSPRTSSVSTSALRLPQMASTSVRRRLLSRHRPLLRMPSRSPLPRPQFPRPGLGSVLLRWHQALRLDPGLAQLPSAHHRSLTRLNQPGSTSHQLQLHLPTIRSTSAAANLHHPPLQTLVFQARTDLPSVAALLLTLPHPPPPRHPSPHPHLYPSLVSRCSH